MAKKKSALSAETRADLARSGLTDDDAEIMGIEDVSAAWCEEHLDIPRAAYKITYYDATGKPIDNPPFYRTRFTQFTKAQRVAGKVYTLDELRYSQPAGSRPYPYLSRRVDWQRLLNDPAIPLTFTEGEKKAEVACKAGINCIGLGGVWNFKSAGRGWALLPELRNAAWTKRRVEICYDSDVMTKREVFAALMELTSQLVERGADVYFIYLTPRGNEKKIGLDDFLFAYGLPEYNLLPREPSSLSQAFQTLNRRSCYLTSVGMFWDFEARVMMTEGHARLTLSPLAKILTQKGNGQNARMVEVPAFEDWVKSPVRMNAFGLTYEPGNLVTITDEAKINLWVAPEVRSKRGAVKKWLDFVHYVFRTPEQAEWFLKWLAYPIQHHGTKLYQAVYVWGPGQGIGKSFVVTPLMDHIYGSDNFSRITNDTISSAFNGELANKQFALLDECFLAGSHDRQNLMSKLKDMVTREKTTVNAKYQKPYVVRDCINYYITSNHEESIPLDPEDRRIFVVRAPDKPLAESEYRELDQWLRDPDDEKRPGSGVPAVLYHLQYKIDCRDFNPKGAALVTEARDGVIAAGMNYAQEFSYRLAKQPQDFFRDHEINKALLDIEGLRALFRQFYPSATEPTANALARALNKYPDELPKREVRRANTNQKYTLWCIDDQSLYLGLPPVKWLDIFLDKQSHVN